MADTAAIEAGEPVADLGANPFLALAKARAGTRNSFLKRFALFGGAALVGGTAFGGREADAAGGPSVAQDVEIFNFALLLEYLQAGFYREALSQAGLRGEVRRFAQVAGNHEQAHVAFLKKALGPKARPQPTFDFRAVTRDSRRFIAAAVDLEELAVGAYNGQAGNLTKKGLAAAIKIVSVEGRHAAWIRGVAGLPPAPRAADPGAAVRDVTAALKRMKIL